MVPHSDREIENEIRLPEEGRQMHRTHTDATVRIVTGWYRTLVRRVPGTLQLAKYYLHQSVNVRILQEPAQAKGTIVEWSLQCTIANIEQQRDP